MSSLGNAEFSIIRHKTPILNLKNKIKCLSRLWLIFQFYTENFELPFLFLYFSVLDNVKNSIVKSLYIFLQYFLNRLDVAGSFIIQEKTKNKIKRIVFLSYTSIYCSFVSIMFGRTVETISLKSEYVVGRGLQNWFKVWHTSSTMLWPKYITKISS